MPKTMHVPVNASVLRWAIQRSGRGLDYFERKFPRLAAWETGRIHPTYRQLQDLAKSTYTPIGYFYLAEPPVEQVPIPDFRTMGNSPLAQPSPNLLEMIYICQQRQEWYRSFARSMGEQPKPFVGSLSTNVDPIEAADQIRTALRFSVEDRRRASTWLEALRSFIEMADQLGILVMTSGVVLNNPHRKLDIAEFRGFALSDEYAPVVFINGTDTKSAQMFTLAHELAHIWIGRTALSDSAADTIPDHQIEAWCNRVAAELLVPRDAIAEAYRPQAKLDSERDRLARQFKVSTLVILRRIHDIRGIDSETFWPAYHAEVARLKAIQRKKNKDGGGDFYNTQSARVGKRFARALVSSTLEGHTLHRDAFRLLGIAKVETFRDLGQHLGVA